MYKYLNRQVVRVLNRFNVIKNFAHDMIRRLFFLFASLAE